MTPVLTAAAFFLGWMIIGLVVARHLIRRGHEPRSMIAIGLGLGPLMGLVASSASLRRRSAQPLTLAEGTNHGGLVHVLVLIPGATADIAAIVPMLEAIAPDLAVLTLARPVPYEMLHDDLDASFMEANKAALSKAADLVPIRAPALALWPGPPSVVVAHFRGKYPRNLVLIAAKSRVRDS